MQNLRYQIRHTSTSTAHSLKLPRAQFTVCVSVWVSSELFPHLPTPKKNMLIDHAKVHGDHLIWSAVLPHAQCCLMSSSDVEYVYLHAENMRNGDFIYNEAQIKE